MSTWGSRAVAGLGWVLVVTAGCLLVWLVVSRVGTGLAGAPDLLPTPTATASPSQGGASPSGTTRARRQDTWQGEVGVVTAACTGPDIALVGAQPEEGVVHVVERGPVRLLVTFRSGEGDSVTTVLGRCAHGRPQLSVVDPVGSQPEAEGSTRETD